LPVPRVSGACMCMCIRGPVNESPHTTLAADAVPHSLHSLYFVCRDE
jgi:hypothetical protein